MKVLFCNIAWMQYYRGITEKDKPQSGGKWIIEKTHLEECKNFEAKEDGSYQGYIYTKSTKGKDGQIKIESVDKLDTDEVYNDVMVIWVAKDPFQNKLNIIGWYKHATVYQKVQYDSEQNRFNVVAKGEDCVLLPINKRHKIVPKAGRSGYSYGMGQSNIWYGKKDDKNSEKYILNMIDYINKYNDDNLLFESNY